MDEAELEKPLPEMSQRELEREIRERSQRYDFAFDVRIGVAIVTALPRDNNHPAIVRSGYPAEDVLRQALRTLRRLQRDPGRAGMR
jgi:hypothetical protein